MYFSCVVLGMEPRALCMLAKGSTTELHPQSLFYFIYLFFEAVSHYVAQAGLKAEMLLPLPP
jgi:hypothetical protein